ncbi:MULTISPECIES: FeoC-like transcriptional regulator [unclassified Roseofilum]|uniref:FeoC-like transcriptional regulator n=1 Tax=unclassified Roseofilum TaxID=2620099 RepID=UPI000E997BD2|nr:MULTISPECIES: FeoC-like transcriptional regulator [unclassified Roseofilum]HBR00174.1 sugar metabolism transcriptional regulator [Cyanobacteria bacterium UBA11691]MBP0010218.1 FeoC-like transcriptional regulator [Roseofilum sp. Belize Diploria]MBP0013265.1 FeoC-like transcriptional regulator [Roseofilum sp. SID3]MBP0026389.1 FeoC-like transcriptional regulator [Roseofilum sp. SID2]MBP0035736.1 FeoC-like transcriptional regulator [Roseofilum sp. Belize BBD 4]
MILELQNYLAQKQKVSLAELETHFRSDPDALRAMLNKLVYKGRVRPVSLEGQKCGGCTHCDTATFEVYEWVGKK